MQSARARLRGFRQATILAVAITAVLLLIFAPGGAQVPGEADHNSAEQVEPAPEDGLQQPEEEVEIETLGRAARDELRAAANNIWTGFLLTLPKVFVLALILILAWLFSRLLRLLILRFSDRWEQGRAISAFAMVGFWLLVFGIAASILAGDFRALLGSLGLVGLALSWALQTPIESFTGWLLNSLKGYYRIGDRIAVGDVFGDVFRIDVLTTTLWEIGGMDRPSGHVHAEQPTGRLITFPNNEILTGTVVNLTRDFPFVWNELDVAVANESDLAYTLSVLEGIAVELLEDHMKEPAHLYEAILKSSGLESSVPNRPQLFLSPADSWVNITIRYLVEAKRRRPWQSELVRRVMTELQRPEHAGKIIPAYHRRQVQFVDHRGRPGQ